MAAHDATPSPDRLVEHTEFVRRIARSLLRDEHLAEDVAQDALLAGLGTPAARVENMGGWLRGVVRNLARMRLRSESRRSRHETAAPRPVAVPSPAEVVARLEASRRVVDAVLALEEPYRSTVVQRFFDDIDSAEIARRSGVPVETVRTRLRRALQQLRRRLDRDAPGGRGAWSAALVPLVRWEPGPSVTMAWIGGTTMAAKSKLAFAAAVLAGVLAGAVGRDLLTIAAVSPDRADPGPDAAAPGRPAETPTALPRRGGAPVGDGAEPRGAGASLVVDLTVPEVRPGGGRVRGRVATSAGAPVAGVLVVASAAEDHEFSLPEPEDRTELSAWVRSTVSGELRRRALDRSASTAPDGSYEIAGLSDARFHVAAKHPEFRIRAAGPSDGRWVRPGETVHFLAVPLGRLRVDVLGPDGARVPEALLVVRGEDDGKRRICWTPEAAEVRLVEGAWSIEAYARNGELAAEVRTVSVAPGSDAPAVVLELRERPAIRGRVRLPASSKPLEWVQVRAIRVAPGVDPADATARLAREGSITTALGMFDHRYRFDGLEPGRYLLGAMNVGNAVLATADVTLGKSGVWQDLVVPEPDSAQYVTVRVVGPGGESVADADVQVGVGHWTPPAGFPSADVVRRADGSFSVRRGASEGRGDEPLRLVVRSRTLGERTTPFDPQVAEPLVVRFDAAATLDVTVAAGAAPEVRGHVTIAVRAAGGDAPPAPDVAATRLTPGEGGSIRVAPVQPGEHEIATFVERPGVPGRCVAIDRITVRPGQNAAIVTVPALASLAVDVDGAAAGETVRLSPLPGSPPVGRLAGTTAADGRAVFDLLPPGRYHLMSTVEGRPCVAVAEVPGDAVVRLRPAAAADSGR